MEKSLPKNTIIAADDIESTEEIIEDIKRKNPYINSLVEADKVFQVLFMRNVNGLTNITIKVDPAIRNAILRNNSKIFIGLKRCHVTDSFPFKICFNCQATCSHLSKDCKLENRKVCRYCHKNHFSRECEVKNDSTKHQCLNCKKSEMSRIKMNAGTHYTNANDCPLIKSIIDNIKSNTLYSTPEKNE